MDVLIGAAISLATLALNAIAGRAAARAQLRSAAGEKAGELLADYVKRVWDKSDDGWVNLENFLARVRGPLHRAGVPNDLFVALRDSTKNMWRHLEFIDQEHGWSSSNERHDAVQDVVDRIYAVLEAKPPWWRRPFA